MCQMIRSEYCISYNTTAQSTCYDKIANICVSVSIKILDRTEGLGEGEGGNRSRMIELF